MLNANWKKKIGIGEPLRYWQAATFGFFSAVLFALFASILVKQNRAVELPVFALAYFVGVVAIQLVCCVIDAERRLQPLEDRFLAAIKNLAQKLKVQSKEYEPDPTIFQDAISVIECDIDLAMNDPNHTDFLSKELVPEYKQETIEQVLDNIKTQSAMKSIGAMPLTFNYGPPMPLSKQEFAREAVKQDK